MQQKGCKQVRSCALRTPELHMPVKPKHKPKAPRQPGLCRHGDRAYTRIRGRWVPLGTWGTPEAQAAYDRTIAEYLANGRRLKLTLESAPPEPTTLSEVILAYWTYAEAKYGSRRYGSVLLGHTKRTVSALRERFGALPAASFGPLALENFRDGLVRSGLARKTVNDRIRIVKSMFSFAVRREMVPRDLKHGLAEVKGLRTGDSSAAEPVKVRPVADEHVDAVLPHVLKPVRAMIELQRITGMRPGEVVIMRGCDLDTTGPLWVYRPAFHKNEHRDLDREVIIGERGQGILKPFLRIDTEAYLFQPVDAVVEQKADKRRRRKSKVQPSQQRRRPKAKPLRPAADHYSVNGYRRAVTRGCDKAWPAPPEILGQGKEAVKTWLKEKPAEVRKWRDEHRWHPHQLRHSAATKLRKLYGIEAARIMLGHASVATTEIYGERDREVALRIAREVG